MTSEQARAHLAFVISRGGDELELEAWAVIEATLDRPAPVAYATLAGRRAKTPSEAVAAELSSALALVETNMRQGVSRALAGIYTEGVRDGFVQGVAAECARRDENGGEP